MARVLAKTGILADRATQIARAIIVTACALALIFAGRALPF